MLAPTESEATGSAADDIDEDELIQWVSNRDFDKPIEPFIINRPIARPIVSTRKTLPITEQEEDDFDQYLQYQPTLVDIPVQLPDGSRGKIAVKTKKPPKIPKSLPTKNLDAKAQSYFSKRDKGHTLDDAEANYIAGRNTQTPDFQAEDVLEEASPQPVTKSKVTKDNSGWWSQTGDYDPLSALKKDAVNQQSILLDDLIAKFSDYTEPPVRNEEPILGEEDNFDKYDEPKDAPPQHHPKFKNPLDPDEVHDFAKRRGMDTSTRQAMLNDEIDNLSTRSVDNISEGGQELPERPNPPVDVSFDDIFQKFLEDNISDSARNDLQNIRNIRLADDILHETISGLDGSEINAAADALRDALNKKFETPEDAMGSLVDEYIKKIEELEKQSSTNAEKFSKYFARYNRTVLALKELSRRLRGGRDINVRRLVDPENTDPNDVVAREWVERYFGDEIRRLGQGSSEIQVFYGPHGPSAEQYNQLRSAYDANESQIGELRGHIGTLDDTLRRMTHNFTLMRQKRSEAVDAGMGVLEEIEALERQREKDSLEFLSILHETDLMHEEQKKELKHRIEETQSKLLKYFHDSLDLITAKDNEEANAQKIADLTKMVSDLETSNEAGLRRYNELFNQFQQLANNSVQLPDVMEWDGGFEDHPMYQTVMEAFDKIRRENEILKQSLATAEQTRNIEQQISQTFHHHLSEMFGDMRNMLMSDAPDQMFQEFANRPGYSAQLTEIRQFFARLALDYRMYQLGIRATMNNQMGALQHQLELMGNQGQADSGEWNLRYRYVLDSLIETYRSLATQGRVLPTDITQLDQQLHHFINRGSIDVIRFNPNVNSILMSSGQGSSAMAMEGDSWREYLTVRLRHSLQFMRSEQEAANAYFLAENAYLGSEDIDYNRAARSTMESITRHLTDEMVAYIQNQANMMQEQVMTDNMLTAVDREIWRTQVRAAMMWDLHESYEIFTNDNSNNGTNIMGEIRRTYGDEMMTRLIASIVAYRLFRDGSPLRSQVEPAAAGYAYLSAMGDMVERINLRDITNIPQLANYVQAQMQYYANHIGTLMQGYNHATMMIDDTAFNNVRNFALRRGGNTTAFLRVNNNRVIDDAISISSDGSSYNHAGTDASVAGLGGFVPSMTFSDIPSVYAPSTILDNSSVGSGFMGARVPSVNLNGSSVGSNLDNSSIGSGFLGARVPSVNFDNSSIGSGFMGARVPSVNLDNSSVGSGFLGARVPSVNFDGSSNNSSVGFGGSIASSTQMDNSSIGSGFLGARVPSVALSGGPYGPYSVHSASTTFSDIPSINDPSLLDSVSTNSGSSVTTVVVRGGVVVNPNPVQSNDGYTVSNDSTSDTSSSSTILTAGTVSRAVRNQAHKRSSNGSGSNKKPKNP